MKLMSCLVAALLLAASVATAAVPTIPDVPETLPTAVRQSLLAKRAPLVARQTALIAMGKAINADCARVETGSAKHKDCLARLAEFNAGADALGAESDGLADEIDAATEHHIITSIHAMTVRLGWAPEEQARVDTALARLARDGFADVTDAQINQVWDDVLARPQDGDLAREAAGTDGLGFPGAGEQTSYNDCVVFALANAAGLPYGAAAARATKLISEADWRTADARANPQAAIETGGLMAGEVIVLTEALGQAEVVKSADFAAVLKEGRPVLVSVVPQDMSGNLGHEVVLTKAFQHNGATWYAVLDSNQGPVRRLFMSAHELNTILQQTGVAYRPEKGTTVKLLR